MRIGEVFIKPYRLFRTAFVLGVSIEVAKHIHLENPFNQIEETCITLEVLVWGVDVQIPKRKYIPPEHYNCGCVIRGIDGNLFCPGDKVEIDGKRDFIVTHAAKDSITVKLEYENNHE